MFAIVVRVQLPEGHTVEVARKEVEADVLPGIKQSPGFVSACFLYPASGNEGMSFTVYKDEASARGAAAMVTPPAHIKLLGVEVREVITSATA